MLQNSSFSEHAPYYFERGNFYHFNLGSAGWASMGTLASATYAASVTVSLNGGYPQFICFYRRNRWNTVWPRDISEIRIFYKREFLCNAIATTIEGYPVSLKEIESERNKQRRKLSKELTISTQSVVEKIKQEKNSNQQKKKKTDRKTKLKRYWND